MTKYQLSHITHTVILLVSNITTFKTRIPTNYLGNKKLYHLIFPQHPIILSFFKNKNRLTTVIRNAEKI